MATKKIEVKKVVSTTVRVESMRLRFTGVSALLMHSARLANPLDQGVKELKKLTASKPKTDAVHASIARMEWELGMYFDPTLGPYMPTENLRKSIVLGARKSKLGKAVESGGVFMCDERIALDYDGPRTLDKLWTAGFSDYRSIVVNKRRVMRSRAKFPTPWTLEFGIEIDLGVIEAQQVLDAATIAGRYIGIGDYRPEGGGLFGRFSVERV